MVVPAWHPAGWISGRNSGTLVNNNKCNRSLKAEVAEYWHFPFCRLAVPKLKPVFREKHAVLTRNKFFN